MTDLIERGLAIIALLALAGCGEHDPKHFERLAEAREQRDRQQAYRQCLFEAKGYFGTASIAVVQHCEARALREVPEWKP